MSSLLLNAISEYGYFGMFLAMILEAVIIVIPSELILATGGILASQRIFSFWGALLTGVIGSVFCAVIIYLMGYFGGRPFIDKYGKYFFMKQEDIEKAEAWFQKYGMLASFIGRNFPIVRTFISLPIGIMRLNFWPFVLYTTLGSIPWTFAFVYVGYSLGNNWTILQEYTSRLKVPIYILLFLLVVRYIYRKVKKRNSH
jgi:SNARE-like domain protein